MTTLSVNDLQFILNSKADQGVIDLSDGMPLAVADLPPEQLITETEWMSLEWSDKPTWTNLMLWHREHLASSDQLYRQLNEACRIAISRAYGGDAIKELHLRLAGQHTPDQDAERMRLIDRCHSLEQQIAAADSLVSRETILQSVIDGTWTQEPTSDE